MALSTASFRGKTAPTPEARKAELEAELAQVTADVSLTRRQELVAELAGLSLPDISALQREMAAKAADLEKQLAEARLAIRKSDAERSYKAAANMERRGVIMRELVASANPRIGAAIETLKQFTARNALRSGHGMEVARAQEAILALDALKIEPIDDAEVTKRVARIMKTVKLD